MIDLVGGRDQVLVPDLFISFQFYLFFSFNPSEFKLFTIHLIHF